MNLPGIAEKIVARLHSRSVIENTTGVSHPVFSMDIAKAEKLIDWPPATLDERLGRFCDALSGALAI
jgi:hypothetical protein